MPNYVVAGASTAVLCMKQLLNHEIADEDVLFQYISNTTPYYLSSIGQGLQKGKKINADRFIENVAKMYRKTYRELEVVRNNVKPVMDSGGYQISIGYISKEYLHDFINIYFKLLDHEDVGKISEYALSLDIVGDKPTFDSVDDLEYFNRYVLDRTIQRDDRDKIYLIYHFANLKLQKFWWKLIQDYFSYFKHFSVGGLVAFGRTATFPFNFYMLPLLKIVMRKLQLGLHDPFIFHILGVSAYTDIFGFTIMEKIINEFYDIQVSINFDSTRAVRETAVGKVGTMFYEGNIWKVSFASKDLSKRVNDKYSNGYLLNAMLKDMHNTFGFKFVFEDTPSKSDIYHDGGKGSMKRYIEALLTLYSTKFIMDLVYRFEDLANNILDAAKNNNETKMYHFIRTGMQMINYGKLTKHLNFKINALMNTIKIIMEKPSLDDIEILMDRALTGVQPFKIFNDVTVGKHSYSIDDLF